MERVHCESLSINFLKAYLLNGKSFSMCLRERGELYVIPVISANTGFEGCTLLQGDSDSHPYHSLVSYYDLNYYRNSEANTNRMFRYIITNIYSQCKCHICNRNFIITMYGQGVLDTIFDAVINAAMLNKISNIKITSKDSPEETLSIMPIVDKYHPESQIKSVIFDTTSKTTIRHEVVKKTDNDGIILDENRVCYAIIDTLNHRGIY